MTLQSNTQITPETVGMLKAGDVEALEVALSQAKRGADKAGCDGWRAQEMCRQIVQLLEPVVSRPAASSPSAVGVGEVDWSSGSVYDQLLTLIHDRDHALRGDERTDPTEIDETVLEIMRITTPTPAPSADHIADAGEMVAVDWAVVGRDLDALRYVLNFADEAKQVRTVMSAFTLPERETTAFRLERLYATIKALAAATPGGK